MPALIMRFASGFCLALILIALHACDQPEGTDAPQTPGIEISRPDHDPGPDAITLTLVDTVPGSFAAGRIGYFDVHPDGSVAFLDGMASEVTIVPSEGPSFRVGGPGDGPGDISRGAGVVFLPDRSIVVQDSRLRRLSVWTRDGAFDRTVPLHVPTSGVTAVGRELLVKIDPGLLERSSPGLTAGLRVAFVRYRDFMPTDTIRPPSHLPGGERSGWAGGALTCMPCPWTPVGDSLIIVKVVNPEYDLMLLDREGGIVRRILREDYVRPRHTLSTWEYEQDGFMRSQARAVTVTGVDLDGIADRFAERIVDRIRRQETPDPLPLMMALMHPRPFATDGEERLWVLLSSTAPDRSLLDVHDLERGTFQTVEVDGVSLQTIEAAGSWVVGLIIGPLGETGLVRLRIGSSGA